MNHPLGDPTKCPTQPPDHLLVQSLHAQRRLEFAILKREWLTRCEEFNTRQRRLKEADNLAGKTDAPNQQTNTYQRELYHRMRNNMQMVVSLINHQARSAQGDEAQRLLHATADRVHSMATTFDLLYDTESDPGTCDTHCLRSLALKLGHQLRAAVNPHVNIVVNVPDMLLEPNICSPLGMIVHECITNAFNHAFPSNRPGTVTVSLTVDKSCKRQLTIADDGIGMLTTARRPKSLGMKIIHLLAEQISGSLAIQTSDGVKVGVQF